MDQSLLRYADPSGVLAFFGIVAAILVGTFGLFRSRNGDWIDEHWGRGSIRDGWALGTADDAVAEFRRTHTAGVPPKAVPATPAEPAPSKISPPSRTRCGSGSAHTPGR